MKKPAMTKEEFKTRWESDASGGGITFNDIADCAEAWGIISRPRSVPLYEVRYAVLKAANTNDAEAFKPTKTSEHEVCSCDDSVDNGRSERDDPELEEQGEF